jgi:hypothetical protein
LHSPANRQPSIEAATASIFHHAASSVGPSILLVQWAVPVLDVVGNHLGGLVRGEIAADGFYEVAFGICVALVVCSLVFDGLRSSLLAIQMLDEDQPHHAIVMFTEEKTLTYP